MSGSEDSRCGLIRETLAATRSAVAERHAGSPPPSLPAVDSTAPDPWQVIHDTGAFAAKVIAVALFWRRGKCFIRSRALATVLRHRGIPVVLNIGLPSNPGRSHRGHCWLSLGDSLVLETHDPRPSFPTSLDCSADGAVHYWAECR